jgi:predicted phosphodiesterase
VRYAVLSDIHANLPALEAALAAVGRLGVDAYLCLGDVVGYGAWPNECCDLIGRLDCLRVRGNHDEAALSPGKEQWFTAGARACILWTREQLSPRSRAFLVSLGPALAVGDLSICHGSIPDPDFYTSTPQEALYSLGAMATTLGFLGHTHYAEWYALEPGAALPLRASLPLGGVCTLEPGLRYLVNPGSVGQPRDGNSMPSFAVYDADAATVEIIRFEYDTGAAQQRILEVGLPEQMARRLSLGI